MYGEVQRTPNQLTELYSCPAVEFSQLVLSFLYEEVLEEGRGPRVARSKGSKVQGSKGARVPRTKISETHIQTRALL